jgi:hypothetical protein
VPTATQIQGTPGDADCDGNVDAGDADLAARSVFDRDALSRCSGVDCDGDLAVTAADVPCVVLRLASP